MLPAAWGGGTPGKGVARLGSGVVWGAESFWAGVVISSSVSCDNEGVVVIEREGLHLKALNKDLPTCLRDDIVSV